MCSEGTWQSRSPIDRVVFYYPLKSNLINDEPKKVVSAFSKINKFPSTSMPAKIKCGANYINSRHAYLDVNANSSEEIIPILLDSKGFVAETSGSSVFVIKGNKVFTPDLNSPILESITRKFILNEISQKIKTLNFIEKKLTKIDLLNADEIFFAGTNAEITSVSKLEGKRFSQRNKVTLEIFNQMKTFIFQK